MKKRGTGPGSHPFYRAPVKKLRKPHRPLVWENMLGTVYARNAEGETKYFDYDYEAAHAFAGTASCLDLRVAKATHATYEGPRAKQWALFGVRPEARR
jgi:hypothetical protein